MFCACDTIPSIPLDKLRPINAFTYSILQGMNRNKAVIDLDEFRSPIHFDVQGSQRIRRLGCSWSQLIWFGSSGLIQQPKLSLIRFCTELIMTLVSILT